MQWKENNKCLEKTFTLKGFSSITQKLSELTKICDALNHHPDLEIYSYKQIRFKLYTHDSNSITEKDCQLAKEIDGLFEA